MTIPDAHIDEMIAINTRQREYYEQANGSASASVNGYATNAWRRIRAHWLGVCSPVDREAEMRQLHQGWLGSLTGARVLELGAGSGSPMSVWLAKTSAEYTAIDLSKPRLDELQATLAGNGVTDASLYATDFLSDDFDQRGFDIVYARSVLHHFRHVEPMLDKLSGCMAPGGMVVSFDPLQTWWGARLFRNCYRPFQTDADWEYPFTKKTFQAIESRFAIEAVQGYFGRSKWALPIAMVAPNSIARSIALRLHRSDQQALTSVNIIPTCLQASLLLRKNGAPQLGVVA